MTGLCVCRGVGGLGWPGSTRRVARCASSPVPPRRGVTTWSAGV